MDVHAAQLQLADSQLKRLKSHLKLHKLKATWAKNGLNAATERVGQVRSAVRKSGYYGAVQLPVQQRRKCRVRRMDGMSALVFASCLYC